MTQTLLFHALMLIACYMSLYQLHTAEVPVYTAMWIKLFYATVRKYTTHNSLFNYICAFHIF
jgi:hypothetical protein